LGWDNYSAVADKVEVTSQGNPLITGTTSDLPNYPSNLNASFMFLEFDKNSGEVIWSSRFPASNADHGVVFDMEVLGEDGSVLCGKVSTKSAVVIRASSTGQEFWRIQYKFLTNTLAINDLFDIEQSADGGFILTGTTRLSQAFPTVLWLLRLDEYGCLEPGCQWTTNTTTLLDLPASAIHLAPNPVHDMLSIRLALPAELQTTGTVRMVVTRIDGAKVHEVLFAHGRDAKLELNTNGFSAGIYVAHFVSDDVLLGSRKFVVE